jgi:ubiquitin C-terminal hydrolase
MYLLMDYHVGLVNLGNTCFLNSCLQVLRHTYELHPLFDEIHKNSPDSELIKEWNDLRKLMDKQNGTVSPNRFVNILQVVAKRKGRDEFTGWLQNDVSEFMLLMLECMHNSISKPLIINIIGKNENKLDERAILCYNLLKSVYKTEYSKVLEILYGTYVTEIREPYTNKILSEKAQHYSSLDVQLFSDRIMCKNIYECLDLFVSPEVLSGENAWYNENTNEKQTLNKVVNFWNFPDILIINLKRFSPDGTKKIQTLIEFPLKGLDLSRYVTGYKSSSYKYDLFGVCNHMGNVMGGHYTAYIKNKLGIWNHYNDQIVKPVLNVESICSPKSYCLFYRKNNLS